MTNDERFGLPFSLAEALVADPSPQAAALAQLLTDGEPAPRPSLGRKSGELTPRHRGTVRVEHGRPWRTAMVGLALWAGVGAQSYAATSNLEGSWAMARNASSFQEAVTGPAPDKATVVVTKDRPDSFAYELVETRRGAEVARGAYNVSFAGAPSTSSVGGSSLQVTAKRGPNGGVVILAPPVGGLQALIRMRQTGPNTALLEHDIQGAGGSVKLERIGLVRVGAEDRTTASPEGEDN